MSSIKVECRHCHKRFSGEEKKVFSIKACPKCGQAGSWWKSLDDHGAQPSGVGELVARQTQPKSSPASSQPVGSTPMHTSGPPQKTPITASRLPMAGAGISSKVALISGLAGAVLLIAITATLTLWIAMGGSNSGDESGTENKAAGLEPLDDTAQLCKLTGKITWKYNDFVGTKGDVGAYVFLLPDDFNDSPISAHELTMEKHGTIYRDRGSGRHSGIIWTRCGGDGQFTLDRIPAGSYRVLICSYNTNGPLGQSNKFDQNKMEFARWFDTEEDMSKLALSVFIARNKYVVKSIDFVAGENRELHHDFGITWW